MLYVAAGLALMFGALGVIGLGAIDQATQLVFEERLATAFTTAGIIERDFARVAGEANEAVRELTPDAGTPGAVAGALLEHLDRDAPFLFFRASGVWLLDVDGRTIGAAGAPAADGSSGTPHPELIMNVRTSSPARAGRKLLPKDPAAVAQNAVDGPTQPSALSRRRIGYTVPLGSPVASMMSKP